MLQFVSSIISLVKFSQVSSASNTWIYFFLECLVKVMQINGNIKESLAKDFSVVKEKIKVECPGLKFESKSDKKLISTFKISESDVKDFR